MLAAALAESEYLLGTSASRTCDNEHATASLGDTEVLTIQNPVGPPVAEVGQRPENDSEIPSRIRGEESGDILNE